jgi:hypothetical protein
MFLQAIIASLKTMPRKAYFIAIPIPIFLVTVAITMATSGGGGDNGTKLALNPTVSPSINNLDTAPTTSPTVKPTSTAVPTATPPNRADCDAIRGTDYESPEERTWFLANCLDSSTTATTDTTTGGGGGGGGGTAATGGGTAATGGGGAGVSGSEYALGARLIIPSINLDTTVQYKFPYFPNLGVTNIVLAGHVDCGRCYDGGSGIAVFWYIRDLAPGATAQYVAPDGSVRNYVVVSSYDVTDGADFSGIVANGTADMTLITCTGTFAGGHYNNRHVVALRLQG